MQECRNAEKQKAHRSELFILHRTDLGGERLDFRRQTALVTSRLILVEDAFISDRIDHSLRSLEQVNSLGFVTRNHGFLHVLDHRTEFGAQCRVGSVKFDVLAGTLEARCRADCLLLSF